MVETLVDAPGVGLAAPQVAVSQRVIVVCLPDDESPGRNTARTRVCCVVVNPEIARLARYGRWCGSLPVDPRLLWLG